MSLSQKHSGKVLVPWFNIAEWNAVYNLIYAEESRNWPKALQVLKIWKLRTPLLSAGVEGTLILLEALLVDTRQLSSFEITHVFSTSLVRLLNLCAANSDKQGTFYKTAMKNGLPKWLISVRHDIAHSHNVPSQSMLKLSLKFCLQWLKEKYWEVQSESMTDLIAKKSDDRLLEDAIYIHIQLSKTEALVDNRELIERVGKLIAKNNKEQLNAKKILEHVNSRLQEIIQSNPQEAADKMCTLLIDNYTILSTECELDESGNKTILRSSINNWKSLLNIIHEAEIMPTFIFKLFCFLCSDEHDFSYKEVASLWICEIFQGLINQENNLKDKNTLHFSSKNNCMKDVNFVNETLRRLTPFTLTFIKQVLEYNNAPSQFIEDAVNLITSFYTFKNNNVNHILTVEDLPFNLTDSSVDNLNEETQSQRSQWTLIEDSSEYRNLPLGVLPHQSRNINPLLDL